MSMKRSKPSKEWQSTLLSISARQWMQALAWRSAMRVLPALPGVSDLHRADGISPRLVDLTVRVLYGAIFHLDAAYRGRLGHRVPPETAQAGLTVSPLVAQLGRHYENWGGRSSGADGIADLISAIAAAPVTAHARAQEAIHAISRILSEHFPALSDLWDEQLNSDLEALEPWDRESRDDLQAFLCQPLWHGNPMKWPELAIPARAWLQAARKSASALGTRTMRLIGHHEKHLEGRLDWEAVRALILEREDRPLAEPARRRLQRLAEDPAQLATLLARMALNDRACLSLAADPSSQGFRQAVPDFELDPAALATLDEHLEAAHPDFTPPPLWTAWVRTARRSAIEAIQADIRSRLPQTDGAADAAPASTSSATAPPRSTRKPARPPRRAARRKK